MKLMVFKVNQLGDNVVFLPVVQWLQRNLRDVEISVFTSPVAAPLYEVCTPGVRVLTADTKVFNSSWRNPAQLLHYHRMVRKEAPDVCLLADDQGNVAHLLARASGARIRVSGRHARVKLSMLLTHREILDLHEHVAVQNWRIMMLTMRALGLPISEVPEHPPAPDLSGFGARNSERLILIHPGASRDYKRWPLDRYVALANALCDDADVCFIRQSHESEKLLRPQVQQLQPSSLQDFIKLMGRAGLFIGNNSGPMNIAAALGIPGIIFCGPSIPSWDPAWHAASFHLLRDPKVACQPCDRLDHPVDRCQNAATPMACMLRWSVDHVRELALSKLLNR